jgi:hypothetical protein
MSSVTTSHANEGGNANKPDFTAMAKAIQTERRCTWREACMIVKRKHPEARAAFHGPVASL